MGRIGVRYPRGAGDLCDNVAATAILREHLPQTAFGVNLLSGREPHTPEKFANLFEPYLKHVRENRSEHFESIESRVKGGLTEAFQLDA